MSVRSIFDAFTTNLRVSNRKDISYRYKRITRQLNSDFRDIDSDEYFSRYVGSYGRKTAIDGDSDMDMLYIMDKKYKNRYDNYSYNGQSSLLSKVKEVISKTYPNTEVGASGQVVQVSFGDGMIFEVVPAFEKSDGSFWYPDSNNGGSWKTTDPMPEKRAIAAYQHSANLKWLCRMTRAWKYHNNVPMGGLLIDTFAYRFLSDGYKYRDKGKTYYDWMTRDFFKYLSNRDQSKLYWTALGSGQYIWNRGKFDYKAKVAHNKTITAIGYTSDEYYTSSCNKWREVFGYKFPIFSDV